MSKYLDVATWDETDLEVLPSDETDEYEYKSSLIHKRKGYRDELRKKLHKVASAFWNSGGGYFIVGVDDKGIIDGGIPAKMGRESLSDWVDTVLHEVEPVGNYQVKLIEPDPNKSLINSGQVVLVIGFDESFNLPHMASDNRYYIRAGAHTAPAKHFIVEALRAKRSASRPILYGNIQLSPTRAGIYELTIATTNQVPAINITVNIKGLPNQLVKTLGIHLPLTIPMVNVNSPFRMEIASYLFLSSWENELKEKDWILEISYYDLIGNEYTEEQILNPLTSVGPLQFGQTTEKTLEEIRKELEKITKALQKQR